MLTVLNVAYPLAPAGPDAVGGAEQVLSHIDRGLVRAGHRSIVLACTGSHVDGTLVSVPRALGDLDEAEVAAARRRHRDAVASILDRWPVDVVHMHGIDFHHYLPPSGVPVLVTLHGPADWYAPQALHPTRPRTWLHCVSQMQHTAFMPNRCLLPPIANGVPVDELGVAHARRGFALVLARIAPEKGIHLALEAAHRADVPLLVAGELFSYPDHLRYFRQEIVPRLDGRRRFIGPVGFRRKRRFLAAARCLIVSSPVEETSSLTAREAAAAGTPVVALRRGALAETVDDGRTGFLVDDVASMAEALLRPHEIDPHVCRDVARRRFSLEQMTATYIERYESLCCLPPRPIPAQEAA